MPRYKLKEAREKAGLTQSAFADLVGCERKAPNYWEAGTSSPRGIYRVKILEVLKDVLKDVLTEEDNDLFKNYPERSSELTISSTANNCPQVDTKQQMSAPCQTVENRDIVNSTDPPPFVIHISGSAKGFREFMELVRRQFIQAVGKLGFTAYFGNIELALVSSPSVDPEYYLDLCKGSMGTWWGWLNQGNYHELERALLKHTPILKQLANTISSPFQGMAANLAAEAKIMQIILATHELDYVRREIHCAEAVRFGQLSGNSSILALALDWQGNTYISCYCQPTRAIAIYNDALSRLDNGNKAFLNQTDIYMGLAVAYAMDKTQDNHEKKARDFVEKAHMTMPSVPELDPLYQCIRMGSSELDQLAGKTYLYLTEHASGDTDYAKLAYSAFEKSLSKDSMNRGYLGQTLIFKAEASIGLDDLEHFVECLEKSLHIAIELNSLQRMSQAHDVLQRVPDNWQHETAVQKLQKDLSHAIVIARR